jgi:gamma-glutamyl hercynylcysteine S-oxide hydrolase
MCRHLAYLGPAIPLSGVLLDPPHSLLHQSFAPVDMRGGGTINADGYGVGWYPADGTTPTRYRRGCPMWADANLPGLAGAITSGAVLAAVRSATVGMPVMDSAAAPFAEGPWLFSHNGAVTGWPDTMVKLAERLPMRDVLTLDAPTDAALIWALLRHRLHSGTPPPEAVAQTVIEVADAAQGSRLNLLLCDGTQAVATTAGHSLSVRRGDGYVLVSSEPLDEQPGWQPVADGKLVVATSAGVEITDWGTV